MCSRSIPLEPDGVAVTVTATEATRENSTRDQSITTHMMPREGDVCRRRWGCEFSAPVPGSSTDGGYETHRSRATSDGAFPRRRLLWWTLGKPNLRVDSRRVAGRFCRWFEIGHARPGQACA